MPYNAKRLLWYSLKQPSCFYLSLLNGGSYINTIKISAAVCVDKGKVRSNNEDNLFFNGRYLTASVRDTPQLISETPNGDMQIYAVFDGMGGEALGEEASLTAAVTLGELSKKNSVDAKNNTDVFVKKFIDEANNRICKKIIESGEKRIGSTMALMCLSNDTSKIYNIGDSRVYLLRGDNLKQISTDHTKAQRMIKMGVLKANDIESRKGRNTLTQHLGIFPDEKLIEVTVAEPIVVEKGDKFLLCSDGLTDMVSHNKIKSILHQNKSVDILCEELKNEALKNGGIDNITVMVIFAQTESVLNKLGKKPAHLKTLTSFTALVLIIGIVLVTIHWQSLRPQTDIVLPESVAVQSIKLRFTETSISKGTKDSMIIVFEPTDAKIDKKALKYISSRPDVIVVNEHGDYTAVDIGTSDLYVQLGDIKSETVTIAVYT